MPQFADRVKTTSTSTGSSAITLSSSGATGYQAFPSSLDGETVGYVIEASGGTDWEIGTGVYTHSTLGLSRTLRSSSTGSLLNLGSGTHTVFLTPAAQDIQIVEAFSSTSDLPSASDNHGRIYHVHGEGAMYFAHSGSWVKLANYSDITTYTHPNHSGEVTSTGDGATVIADNVVDEANLKVSNSPTDGYVLTARSGNTGGLTWEAVSGGGGSSTSALTETTFSATANQTAFVVSGGITNASNVSVFQNGVKLEEGASKDYTVNASTDTVTLNSGATASDVVEVLEYGQPASSGSGVTVYTGLSGTDGTPSGATYLLNASSPSAGDLAYVSSNTSLYQNNGNGWYRIAVINTTPTISSVADASSNTTPFTLEGGTNTVITVTASDADEGTDLTYSHSVTSGSLNGTTVTQGTGANENVFTIAPHASNATTFSITFTVSDSINAATSVAAFTLEFVVTDSHFTSLLMATDGSAGNNQDDISDATGTHTITVNGDAYAGTFSPYRHGGYSTYFDGSGDYLSLSSSSDFTLDGDFTIDFWINVLDSNIGGIVSSGQSSFSGGASALIWDHGTQANKLSFWAENISSSSLVATNTLDLNTWYFISIVRDNGVITIYQDGSSVSTYNSSSTISLSASGMRIGAYWNGQVNAYITDFRIVKGTPITPASGGPTERLTAITNTSLLTCHLPYIADGSSSAHSITINGDPETKPFGPYDYQGYSASTNGGSIEFDGSGDYVSPPGHADFAFSTNNDFTIEFFVYIRTHKNYTELWDARTTSQGSTTASPIIYSDSNGNIYFFHSNSNRITGSLKKNQWTHVALCRASSQTKLFINGSQAGSTYSDTTDYVQPASNWSIGASLANNDYFLDGSMSDIRVVNGTAVYSGNFTPPTGPLTTTGGTYPSTTNVNTSITSGHTKLLISGTDAHVLDKSQTYNLKLVGNAAASTTQAKFSNTASVYFDGDADEIAYTVPTLSGDFTFEAFIYPESQIQSFPICFTPVWDATAGNRIVLSYDTSTDVDKFTCRVGSNFIVPSSTSSTGQWYHLAVVRSGSTVSMYIGGIRIGTQTYSGSISSRTGYIGGNISNSTGGAFKGYIQDFRFTNGLARYTAADESSNIPSSPLKG